MRISITEIERIVYILVVKALNIHKKYVVKNQ